MGNYRIGYPMTAENPTGEPLPTQKRFHQSTVKYRLLSSGFGSGKTTSIVLETIKESFKYPKNFILIGRKDLGELRNTLLKELMDMLPENLVVSHDKNEKLITLVNGTQIGYINLDDSREASKKIKGMNIGTAVLDQIEEIDEVIFLSIVGRMRRKDSSRNMIATCNPEGHNWVWERWKNNPQPGFELFETTTLENKYLPEDYIKELLNYPEKWVKRYVYGSWDDFEGSVYSEFVEAIHKIPRYQPHHTERKYIILDYGYRNPTAVLFISVDYDGICRIYDEMYEPQLLIPEIVSRIKLIDPDWMRAYRLIDPSTSNVQRDGRSVADEFMMNGMYFNPADNDVLQGIVKVNDTFKRKELFVCENCIQTLKEIGKYHWKQVKPNQQRNEYEEPVKKDDHACDAIRYFINYIYIPVDHAEKQEPPNLGVKSAQRKMSYADF